MIRNRIVAAVIIVLGLVSIGVVTTLFNNAQQSKQAQLRLADIKVALSNLQAEPYKVDPVGIYAKSAARKAMFAHQRAIDNLVGELRKGSVPESLNSM